MGRSWTDDRVRGPRPALEHAAAGRLRRFNRPTESGVWAKPTCKANRRGVPPERFSPCTPVAFERIWMAMDTSDRFRFSTYQNKRSRLGGWGAVRVPHPVISHSHRFGKDPSRTDVSTRKALSVLAERPVVRASRERTAHHPPGRERGRERPVVRASRERTAPHPPGRERGPNGRNPC
jgi:hypothetical protein